MHPDKVQRNQLHDLCDLPNIGPKMAAALRSIGIHQASNLINKSAYALYDDLCAKTQLRQDPCVIDVFLSITDFMAGNPAKLWWAYTAQRKQHQQSLQNPRRNHNPTAF